MDTNPGSMAPHSDQACRACKKQKRRCDKGLPECSLCRRTGRLCEYNDAPDPPPTASDLAALRARLCELEDRLANSASNHTWNDLGDARSISSAGNEFPVALFLDLDCFVWSRLQLPAPAVTIPMVCISPGARGDRIFFLSMLRPADAAPADQGLSLQDVLALLSQGNAVVDTSQDYFATVHTWMPIVSKKRMDLGIPVHNGGPDLAMLFFAMRLVIAQADEVVEGRLYAMAKSFLATLEGNGVVSLLCLQAMVLVALYEYGHAIYPAAWMTVGACARYADILMLSSGGGVSVPILSQPVCGNCFSSFLLC
jgi:hypothetical protein